MRIPRSVGRFWAWLSRAVPKVSRWLWAPAAIVFAIGRIKSGDSEGSWKERIPEILPLEQSTPWLVFLFISSVLYVIASKRKWRSASWFSMASWVFAMGAFLIWYEEVSLPSILTVDYPLVPEFSVLVAVLDLHLMIVMAVLLAVLSLHTVEKQEGSHAIGGRWKPVWSWLLGMMVYVLFVQVSPLGYLNMMIYFGPWSGLGGLLNESQPTVVDHAMEWLAMISPLTACFLVAAWKTQASLAFSEDRMTVGLGKELPLFTVAWKKILSVTELVVPGRPRSIVIEHAALPWYRLRFGLHESRDGSEVVDEVLRRTPHKRQEVKVRRGTTWIGIAMIVGSLISLKAMERLQIVASERMAESTVDFVPIFESSGYFLELGLMQLGAAVLFGFGVALAFARNYGGVRTLPLLGVAVGAYIMATPLIYWLVYISIYAILVAVQTPVLTQSPIHFPDESSVIIFFWAATYKAPVAVCAYFIGAMVAVRPWYRAIPWWPYSKRVSAG